MIAHRKIQTSKKSEKFSCSRFWKGGIIQEQEKSSFLRIFEGGAFEKT